MCSLTGPHSKALSFVSTLQRSKLKSMEGHEILFPHAVGASHSVAHRELLSDLLGLVIYGISQ